ncbi:TIGR02270 family protein [Vitiosangium sp. GDMCC 1.1324]|uniref:TIGR02270 family protein n=1 Tax=Vitiosangium sp. (strain GDMCC 1.1324) TaxID=2138576 RepID=UPI000D340025|nr:TIGR02270 family protein [Vitiosangium sp. GDMCC 1.1324]PTL77045.1 hypothetical protein DAT35_46210 [Vitiosangium sp. GDMCC 1.1324]
MRARRPDRTPRWDVLEDCFDEARFQWMQRESYLHSPELTLARVADVHEERLRAYVDVLAHTLPAVAERLLHRNLREDDRERVAVAALALLARGEGADIDAVLEQLRGEGAERREWVGEVLAVCDCPRLSAHLLPLLEAEEEPEVRGAVLEALTVRQEAPGAAVLTRALGHPTPEVRLAALRAARRWPWDADGARVRRGLDSAAPVVRAAALEAGLVQGQRSMWRACQDSAEAPDALGRTARLLLALGGEEEDVARLVKLLEVPLLRRDTLWALGFSGRLIAAEACRAWLGDSLLGGLAGEAFCAITGLKLRGRYVLPRTEEEAIPPLEEDLRTPLLPGPDDELPMPETSEVERWWMQARKAFEAGTRYLDGRPFTAARLLEVLEEAPMRRRPTLALELSIRSAGEHGVETRTWARVQHRQMASAREWRGGPALRPFVHWMSR